MASLRDKMKARAKKNAQEGARYLNIPNGLEIYKPKKGKALINVLPYIVNDAKHPEAPEAEVGKYWFRRPIRVHYNIGPDNQAVICPTSVGKRCPVCEERQRMLKDDTYTKKETDDLKYKEREVYIITDEDDKDRPVKLWEFSRYNFGKVLETELAAQGDEHDEYYEFFDPDKGFALELRFDEETTGSNKYLAVSRIDFRERRKDITDKMLDTVPDLDKIATVLDYDVLRALFLDLGDDGGSTERSSRRAASGDDDAPRSPRASREEPEEERPARSRASREEPEDERPARSRASREEPEEEAPARSRGEEAPRRPSREEPEEEAPRRSRGEEAPAKNEEAPARRRGEPAQEPAEEQPAPRRGEPNKDAGTKAACPSGHPFGEADKHESCEACGSGDWEACKTFAKSQEGGNGGRRRG